MYIKYPEGITRNDYVAFHFNKRLVKVVKKYGYVSLDTIVQSQYYFPSANNRFNPIKRTGKCIEW